MLKKKNNIRFIEKKLMPSNRKIRFNLNEDIKCVKNNCAILFNSGLYISQGPIIHLSEYVILIVSVIGLKS